MGETRQIIRLIVPVRGRLDDLVRLLGWWNRFDGRAFGLRMRVIEFDRAPNHAELVERAGDVDYLHVYGTGVFQKTKILNIALAGTREAWMMPFDVDLIPTERSIERHVALALSLRDHLVTGHRLMVEDDMEPDDADLAPEDGPSALRKQLLFGERFGVCPIFRVRRLEKIGGWDESFVGWGGEDQDVIERYLGERSVLLRSPDITYWHYNHSSDPMWSEEKWAQRNRARYYRDRSSARVVTRNEQSSPGQRLKATRKR